MAGGRDGRDVQEYPTRVWLLRLAVGRDEMRRRGDALQVDSSEKRIESYLTSMIGEQLVKSWNIFATRIFYFGGGAGGEDYRFMLTLECPWRIVRGDRILVGFEDYYEDSDEQPDAQLQDETLAEILGGLREGSVYTNHGELYVAGCSADVFGGFQLMFSGGYVLQVFPTTRSSIEWHLCHRGHWNVGLWAGGEFQEGTDHSGANSGSDRDS